MVPLSDDALRNPMVEEVYRPTRVRMADRSLADIEDEEERDIAEAIESGRLVTTFIPAVYRPIPGESDEEVEVTLKLRRDVLKQIEACYKQHGLASLEDFLKAQTCGLLGELDDDTIINMMTMSNLTPRWNRNIGRNRALVMAKGKDIEAMPKRGGRAVIVGAGPGVEKHDHLAALADARAHGNTDLVATTDRMLPKLLAAGVVPDLVCSIDASPRVKDFYMLPEVEKHLKDFDIVFPAVGYPPLLEWLMERSDRVYVVVPGLDDVMTPNVTAMWTQFLEGKFLSVNVAGNTGTMTWAMAGYLGCKKTALIGFNMGYERDQNYIDTTYYKAFCKHFGADPSPEAERSAAHEMVEKCYKWYDHPCIAPDYMAVTDTVFDGYAKTTLKFFALNSRIGPSPEDRIEVYNCTEGGILCPKAMKTDFEVPNLRCVPFARFLAGREDEPDAAAAPTVVPAPEA